MPRQWQQAHVLADGQCFLAELRRDEDLAQPAGKLEQADQHVADLQQHPAAERVRSRDREHFPSYDFVEKRCKNNPLALNSIGKRRAGR